ncbi:MAG: hypothetical protein Q9M14_00635, partial [Mariprofundaceae bacterium]|nr:hypothetical protein [Mariprofundaceae bacterium]
MIEIIGSYQHDHASNRLPDRGADTTVIALLTCFLDTDQAIIGVKAVNYLASFGADANTSLCTALQAN